MIRSPNVVPPCGGRADDRRNGCLERSRSVDLTAAPQLKPAPGFWRTLSGGTDDCRPAARGLMLGRWSSRSHASEPRRDGRRPVGRGYRYRLFAALPPVPRCDGGATTGWACGRAVSNRAKQKRDNGSDGRSCRNGFRTPRAARHERLAENRIRRDVRSLREEPVDLRRVAERLERDRLAVVVEGQHVGALGRLAPELAGVRTTTLSPSATKSCGVVRKPSLMSFPTAPLRPACRCGSRSARCRRLPSVHAIESSRSRTAPSASPLPNAA
jgi:hypothetical protein